MDLDRSYADKELTVSPMTPPQSPYKTFVQSVALFVVVAGTVYQCGHPWTCEDAKRDVLQKERTQKKAFEDSGKTFKDGEEKDPYRAVQDLMYAKAKETEKCYQR